MWQTTRTGCVSQPDVPPPGVTDTRRMLSSQTTYHSESRTSTVLSGASHSDAWAYVAKGGPLPKPRPASNESAVGRVRRHGSSRERRPSPRALIDIA